MGVRFSMAKGVGAVLTWGLRNVVHRPAANMPGKLAMYVDPLLIAHLSPRVRESSIVVVGTNGKTTVTNLLADVIESTQKSVVCNRTGANLRSGVATALMQSKGADWGVIECDELWLAKVLPQFKSDYLLLLNLFRDQLDRFGEIDRLQDSIVSALELSPQTILIYNADDPLCAMIAKRASEIPARRNTSMIAFGVGEDMGLAQNVVSDATMCQVCSSMFEYEYRQYGQLGKYRCPVCGFARPPLHYAARNVRLDAKGLAFDVFEEQPNTTMQTTVDSSSCVNSVHAPFSGAYMVYNLLAIATVAHVLGISSTVVQSAIDAFNPRNGRLQDYEIDGHHVLLNLAKNPTGFNLNLKIVAQDKNPKVVAFFINDKEADGHDISWIWDIDFEELVAQRNCVVFAGGIRKNDLQVRLKYAGVSADLIDGVNEVFSAFSSDDIPQSANVYAIANYTALPAVKSALDAAESSSARTSGAANAAQTNEAEQSFDVDMKNAQSMQGESETRDVPNASSVAHGSETHPETLAATSQLPLVIAHLFPDLMNLYGDGGNVRILEQRCSWRGIPVEVRRVFHGQEIDLSAVDLVFLGGGPDREQRLASADLMTLRDDLAAYVEDDGALLAICGGYQILGNVWLLGDEEVPGLGIIDIETHRPGTSADRLIDNIVLRSSLATIPVVGYENHAGRTYLNGNVKSFGSVISSVGHGNNDTDKVDGVCYRNVIGTYLHGPLLSKNPEVADYLLDKALQRYAHRSKTEYVPLSPLDDAEELAANEFMCRQLGISIDRLQNTG